MITFGSPQEVLDELKEDYIVYQKTPSEEISDITVKFAEWKDKNCVLKSDGWHLKNELPKEKYIYTNLGLFNLFKKINNL